MIQRFFVMFITCLFLLVTPVCLLAAGFCLPPQYDDTFLGELKYKCARLEETEGKRIVLVGGSSVAFGVDSQLLEQEFPDDTVVNFGMYAALGTKVMLDLSVDQVHSGDIVIISPEQEAQALSAYFNGEAMWQALDGAFGLLLRIRREDWGSLIGQFPYFAARKAEYVLSGEVPVPDGVYSRRAFDECGDIVSNECAYNVMANGYDMNTPVQFQREMLEEEFVQCLNDYANTLTRRGAVVWYRFCPMNTLAVEREEDVDGYYDFLQEQLEFSVIGDPHNSIMDAEWFYDTNFHLNSSGKIVNTRQLVRDIKAMLGDSSPTEISLPEKPACPKAVLQDATDSVDAEYFTWEGQENGAMLTGLTDAGQKQTQLTVPAFCDGLPISTLPADVFSGNSSVQTIILQDHITFIEDHAFDGCTALKKVIMESEQPSDCVVGQHLLDGTDAVVYVKEGVLSSYKLNYFWSRYAGRIRPLIVS